MATRIATTSGNFGLTATWGGSAPPTAADSAVFATGVDVQVTDARTVLTWTQQGSGRIQIAAGGSLTSIGDAIIEGDATATAKVTMAAGASLLFAPGTGATAYLRSGTDYYRYCGVDADGASGARCAIGKAPGALGTIFWRHGIEGAGPGLLMWMYGVLDAEYTDFDGWGTSGSDAAELYPRNNGEFRAVNCRFRDGGRWNIGGYDHVIADGHAGELTLTDTVFSGTLGTHSMTLTANGAGSGASVVRCTFDRSAEFVGTNASAGTLLLSDCTFFGKLEGNYLATAVDSSGHLFYHDADSAAPGMYSLKGTHRDCYHLADYSADPSEGNPHWWNSAGGLTLEDSAFEYRGSYVSDTGDCLDRSDGNTTMRRCLVLPSSVPGITSGAIWWLGGTGLLDVEHCTIYAPDNGSGVRYPHSTPIAASSVRVRSCLFWTDQLVDGYGIACDSPATAAVDALPPADCTGNAFCGLAAGTCTVGGASTPLVGFDGCEFSVAPTGNLDLGADEAGFADPSRNFYGWSRTVRGHSGSDDAVRDLALADIAADRPLVRNSLLPWVFGGFVPSSSALATAGHDGATIGAVPIGGGSSGEIDDVTAQEIIDSTTAAVLAALPPAVWAAAPAGTPLDKIAGAILATPANKLATDPSGRVTGSATLLDATPTALTAAPTTFPQWLVWLTCRFRRTSRNKTTGQIQIYGTNSTTVVTTQTSTDTSTSQTTGPVT